MPYKRSLGHRHTFCIKPDFGGIDFFTSSFPSQVEKGDSGWSGTGTSQGCDHENEVPIHSQHIRRIDCALDYRLRRDVGNRPAREWRNRSAHCSELISESIIEQCPSTHRDGHFGGNCTRQYAARFRHRLGRRHAVRREHLSRQHGHHFRVHLPCWTNVDNIQRHYGH